ncbi:MAG: trehalose/maltose transport system substrate-binding protein [Nocardioidaceae bacterium]|nr:trehalose/maltose transport system substrate-binding protein [Nocardioidaceae bacterium]
MIGGSVVRNVRRCLALGAAATLTATLLAACGGGNDGRPQLVWYTNPDSPPPPGFKGAFGQAGIAARCSTADYKITTQQLPGDASQQRIQLARRLAAKDQGIDLMSLDPVFVSEFSNAGFLAKIPTDQAGQLTTDTLEGAKKAATWDDKLAAAPLWANTQLLWYRKSIAEKAGLDMTKPVTWGQIIDAAAKTKTTVGVQANKYEGYSVLINALVQGAGGDIVSDVSKGVDAKVDINSAAGKAAAGVLEKLAKSPAKMPDLSVSNEGTVLGPFGSPRGGFIVNWTFIYSQYKADKTVSKDLGFTRYPRTTADNASRPPLGGIDIGVNEASSHKSEALDALTCITSAKNQAQYAAETGNMPSSSAAYAQKVLTKAYPADLLAAFQSSIEDAGPRPVTPYWSDISSSLQSTWHPASRVSPSTPKRSASFIKDVLDGSKLL